MCARAHQGQASVELVAAVPLLLLGVLVAAQLAAAGYAAWAAGEAARAGARAAHVGGDGAAAAKRAAPAALRPEVRVDGDAVAVGVRVPALLPGLPPVRLTSSSALDLEPGP